MVLNPTNAPNSHKVKKLDDLASELGSDAVRIRANEGEAANHGVYFDDTEYDYMQHLRDLNSSGGGGTGDVVFVEAKQDKDKNKNKGGKGKQSLEDALRQLDVEDAERKKRELLDEDFLPSKNLRRITYQAQQDVPDAIGGFQPDMDPRLREVLEALEDEAYVDDEEDDIFQQLAKDGRELDSFEFEEQGDFFDDEEDGGGWESDDTAKPNREYKDEVPSLVPIANLVGGEGGEDAHNENWLEDFKQFKKDQKQQPAALKKKTPLPPPSNSDLQSSLFTTTTNGGLRRKKRKGALTNQSGYSMTSSSMVRTEQLGILDERFEQMEARHYNPAFDEGGEDGESLIYGGDDDDNDGTASAVSGATGMSTASSVTGATRHDFDDILDDFLGGYSMHGKKHIKKGGWKNGVEQYDEIRRELGPAHTRGRYGASSGGGKSKQQQQQQQSGAKGAAALAFGAPAAASSR